MDSVNGLHELASLAQTGDEQAFSKLTDAMHSHFIGMAKSMGRASDTLVDDLYHEATVSLMKSVPAWDEAKSPFAPWACECARRAMYSHLRHLGKESISNVRLTGSEIELTCDQGDNSKLRYDSENGEYLPDGESEPKLTWNEVSERSNLACAAVEAIHKLDKSQREMVMMVLSGVKTDDIVQWMVDNGHISQEVPERLWHNHAKLRMRRCLEMIGDYIRDIDPEMAAKVAVTRPID